MLMSKCHEFWREAERWYMAADMVDPFQVLSEAIVREFQGVPTTCCIRCTRPFKL